MAGNVTYEEALALAATLSSEQLAQLLGALNGLWQARYGTWTALHGVEEVRAYHLFTALPQGDSHQGRRRQY